jgi:NOL1/NOP2/fmu family ribosome biogenesis protein
MCAAPGGKGTLLASAMPAGSVLVSNEVVPARTNILSENMRRWGNSNVIVTKRDAQAFARVPNFFDVILVDAPCSGEGMFRKDATSREQWSQDLIDTCAVRQKDIVSSVLPALRPGGMLIYATCTYAPEENEQLVDWLLATYDLEPQPLEPRQGAMLEQMGVTPVTIQGSEHAAFRCFPHRVQGEGMFFCRLKKSGDTPVSPFSPADTPTLPRAATDFLRDFVQGFQQGFGQGEVNVVLEKNHLYYQPAGLTDLINAKLATAISALNLGKLHGKGARQGVIPSHELALSTLLREDVASIHLNEATALRYLQKEDLTAEDVKNPAQIEQGWVVARFEGLALGWLKATKGHFNNALPLNWRIRKQLE